MSRLTSARRRPAARRGTILVVVLALLTIFAVVGITFVFYSDGEMVAARYYRESETRNGINRPELPPFDDHAELALGSVIFGADPTDANAQLNSLRGHDLLTGIYGAHGKASAVPYSGAGIMHENLKNHTDTTFAAVSDRAQVVNHTLMKVGAKAYVFDPEISGEVRDAVTNAPIKTDDSKAMTGRTHVAKNAPYTYPDLNNFYLASVSPATGEVLTPSYFREWHFNRNNPNPKRRLAEWNPTDAETQFNTDWITVEGRARTLRPRPIDQLDPSEGVTVPTEDALGKMSAGAKKAIYDTIDQRIRDNPPQKGGHIIGYPRPNADNSVTGDVFNYIGGVGPQRNDSILIDFGAAPFEWPTKSGKYIKPLAAVLITDTDGSLNLNAHGNTRNSGNHISYHGFGPWEVNLESATANKTEASTIVASRYGKWGSPAARNNSATQTLAFDPSARRIGLYGQVNWDATGTLAMGTKAVTIPAFATGANPFAVVPNYATGFFDDNTDPKKADNHPALFNPSDWAAFPEGTSLNPLPGNTNPALPFGYTYTHGDTRRLKQRYAGELDLYQQMTFNKLAGAPSGTLIGSFPAGPTYRTDPAHMRRGLFTTLSAGLDQPVTMPQGSEANAFKLTEPSPYPAPVAPQPMVPVHAANAKLTAATSAGTFLGPVNLNRPLHDYRGDRTNTAHTTYLAAPLSLTNIYNADKAWVDRHNFARDIFIRLVVATGAINGGATLELNSTSTNYGKLQTTASANTPEFNGLRYLAQLAVNIVDYIDGDDVSTAFVWNPSGGWLGAVDTAWVSTTAKTDMDAASIGERVVFGVEVPRLVINEVYSEIVNVPSGKTAGKGGGTKEGGLARFWVELLNPATPVSPAAAKDGVLGTGKVVLKDPSGVVKPYKLTIVRGTRGGTKAADHIRYNPANVAGDLPSGYAADIDYDFTDAGAGGVANTEVEPNNGKYDPAGDPALGVVIAGPKVTGADPTAELDPKQLTGPPQWAKMMIESTAAAPVTGLSKGMEYGLSNAEVTALDQTKAASEYRRHVVLLRRLANPYLAEDAATNPYITVDVMDWVPSNDAVFTGNGSGTAGGVPIAQRVALGRVQPYAGHSYPDDPAADTLPKYTFPTSTTITQAPSTPGTNEPLHTLGRHNGKSTTPPAGVTLTPAAQTPTATPPSLGDTVMAPYDWLVHLDRPLVNQLELLHLQAGKPHEVTYYFLQPPTAAAGEDVRKQVGLAPWFGLAPEGATSPQIAGHPFTLQAQSVIDTSATGRTNNGLFRGLEFLRAKPWTYGAASGGRVHGRLNLNTIQDIRVWNALSDPQAASGFTQAISDTLWTDYFTSQLPPSDGGKGPIPGKGVRTYTSVKKTDAMKQNWTVPSPGETVDDADPFADPDPAAYAKRLTMLDRPFKPFGAADAPPPPTGVKTWSPPLVSPAGSGLQDTIFRVDADSTLKTQTGRPMLWPATPTHPYLEAELARKVFNNTTTTSNVFTVHLTIVYHEVRANTAATPPVWVEPNTVATDDKGGTASVTRAYLGRESFREAPGDMRQQYLVVVDRSNALVQPPYPSATQDLAPQPFHASLAADLAVTDTKMTLLNSQMNGTTSVVVYADGQPVEIKQGTRLRIGTGPNADWVEVTSVLDNKGVYEINFKNADSTKTGLQNPHAAGVVVTNASFGRPTQPTSNFNPIRSPDVFRQRGYPLFIPYAGRIR